MQNKANGPRPKVPIIDLPKIFEDHIKVLKFNFDHSAIGLKCVIQPQAWACSIINLIYIEKTKKDIEDYKEGRPLESLRDFTMQWF